MPLTAFSKTREGEFDVEQVLSQLSALFGQPYSSVDRIPEDWRSFLREDLECPSCFAAGAEVVRGVVATSGKRSSRQSYFRFTTPGHRLHCDFGSEDAANVIPENLVAFGDTRSSLTRAVRELVCTGIDLRIFSQRSIRDMRAWFFNRKEQSHIAVSLNPNLRSWLSELQKASFFSRGALPTGVILTAEIAAMPGFDWRAEAARRVLELHPEHVKNMAAVQNAGVAFFGDIGERVEALARRFQGKTVFDPTVLAAEYRRTCALAEFIGHNYAPLKASKGASATNSVLAFGALLLFIHGWDASAATADFARIAAAAGHSTHDLGNVMGLNPFHDYQAWTALKRLQDLNIAIPDDHDVQAQRRQVEAGLRAQYGAPPATTLGHDDAD
jgi:hypothetical protein